MVSTQIVNDTITITTDEGKSVTIKAQDIDSGAFSEKGCDKQKQTSNDSSRNCVDLWCWFQKLCILCFIILLLWCLYKGYNIIYKNTPQQVTNKPKINNK
jgi:hypothetical protein